MELREVADKVAERLIQVSDERERRQDEVNRTYNNATFYYIFGWVYLLVGIMLFGCGGVAIILGKNVTMLGWNVGMGFIISGIMLFFSGIFSLGKKSELVEDYESLKSMYGIKAHGDEKQAVVVSKHKHNSYQKIM